MWISVYKRQIYQIAESNRKNRFGSENRIETFLPELECSSGQTKDAGRREKERWIVQLNIGKQGHGTPEGNP